MNLLTSLLFRFVLSMFNYFLKRSGRSLLRRHPLPNKPEKTSCILMIKSLFGVVRAARLMRSLRSLCLTINCQIQMVIGHTRSYDYDTLNLMLVLNHRPTCGNFKFYLPFYSKTTQSLDMKYRSLLVRSRIHKPD
jgi:hypothetical protein